ncbi:MAG: ABC transporter ATP-binding protein, partial [Ruminococcus sp.]|nr:ABC transporter ATP-binding protein [Ruminococcus sp.]
IVEIRELILKLNRERQITVLISSHILDELSRLATHYGFIDGGQMVKEISAEELEQACRKCMRVTVSDMNAFSMVMDRLKVEYSVIDDRTADIFAQINVTELVFALHAKNCQLITVAERDESLESYFINLIGGGKNE